VWLAWVSGFDWGCVNSYFAMFVTTKNLGMP